MAYVNFWKGLAANYSAETHAEGIYQCTDTGNTYIFGVKNQPALVVNLQEDFPLGNTEVNPSVCLKYVNAIENKVPIIQVATTSKGDVRQYPIIVYVSEETITIVVNEDDVSASVVAINISKIVVNRLNGSYTRTSFGRDQLGFSFGGDGTKFLSDDGTYKAPDIPDILIQAEGDPLYFNPADSLENLQTLTFPQVTPDWLSSNFHDKYLIINQNSAQGTFGDGIQRFYTFVYQDFDWGQKGITLEWVLRVSSTEIKYRRIQIQVSTSGNTVTVIEWPLGASEVDLTGYKKIEEVSSLPASPDANTIYVIPE